MIDMMTSGSPVRRGSAASGYTPHMLGEDSLLLLGTPEPSSTIFLAAIDLPFSSFSLCCIVVIVRALSCS